jgi:hypothetical protein
MCKIEKEINSCFESTKDWEKNEYNKAYHRGVHDAYVHLKRCMD